jgi:hypothetical protein
MMNSERLWALGSRLWAVGSSKIFEDVVEVLLEPRAESLEPDPYVLLKSNSGRACEP